MSVENKIPIIIATSNQGKIEQARRELSSIELGSIDTVSPSFNEDEIKKSVFQQELQHPLEYPLLISRKKIESLRNNGEEGLIVVSDSVVVANDGESWLVLNRDGIEEERKKFLEIIKTTGKITFVGAVTFGLLPDKQSISVMSFCEIPISSEKLATLSLPVSIDELEELKDSTKPIKVGYLDYSFNQTSVRETDNFNSDTGEEIRARPYISGLTKDVLSITRLIAETQLTLESILEEFIAKHPFNTISYYANTIGFSLEKIKEFYKDILKNDFFEQNGGNCSLHTFFLARKLEDLGNNTEVVIFPSKNPVKENGHSGIVIKKDGMFFLLDPGLSAPHILPFSLLIPLFYNFDYGENKKISLLRSNSALGFSMIVESKKGRIEFPAINFLNIEQFLEQVPQILFDLHDKRKIIKIDFHDKSGRKLERILINLETKQVLINNQIFNLEEASDIMSRFDIENNLREQIIKLINFLKQHES